MNGHGARQAPPPPPHATLPEDFQDMSRQNGAERQLEARKKEMQAELDGQLKQLDSERKQGLYRLDWELAEAIEALHEKHAERANRMVRQHKETLSQMEMRAQAGENPDTVQQRSRAGPPVRSPAAQPARQYQQDYSSESESSDYSSDESSGEEGGFFGRVMNMVLGPVPPPVRKHPQGNRRLPQNKDRPNGSPKMEGADMVNGYGMSSSLGMSTGPQPHGMGQGPYGSPEMTNGFSAGTSPMSMINPSLGLGSPTHDMASEVPYDMPPLLPYANRGKGQQMPSWPPNNVYHRGGYA